MRPAPLQSIVLVPLGGLCNRLRAMQSAMALARDVQAPLHIIWLRDAGLGARYSDLFAPLAPWLLPAEGRLPLSVTDSSAFRYAAPTRRNLRLPALWQRLAFDTCLSEAHLRALLQTPADKEQLLERLRPRLRGRVLIHTGLGFYPSDDTRLPHLFVPSSPVRSLLDTRLPLLTPHTVGLHIRRTDNQMSALRSPLSAFEAAMAADIARDPEATFYLATDDASVAETLASRHPGRILTSPCQTSVGATSSSQTNRRGFYAGRSDVQGMQEAVAELFTLIACPRFHGSYWSSFSDAVVGCHPVGTADIVSTLHDMNKTNKQVNAASLATTNTLKCFLFS